LAVQTLDGALPILALHNSREALARAVVAPARVIAVVVASTNTAVHTRVLGIAVACEIHALTAAVAIIWALFN